MHKSTRETHGLLHNTIYIVLTVAQSLIRNDLIRRVTRETSQ